MHYVIAALFALIWVFAGFSQHYKSELKHKATELTKVSEAYAQNIAMLASYELQNRVLKAQLTELNALAQQRQAQLDEVLNHEQNQTWTSQRVPDNVNRLFEQRNTTARKSAVNLPANDRMPGNYNPNAY
ncbi:hypothetical protein HYE54_03630 [Aggregatibacter actinomycetemcomitans]|uniref:hypothetical protein n=1 Tax=Aggregatibacter actinomycetemcomitans TaxID=714 RepID=UPI00197B12DD|nr:hypothetical protein [Aggregatibacter actinomycetemcomitans]MBN6067876.1 hypothetical protein [Aggregatibacter actinomycetemcomitans]MBN6085813.1 hypothetical protein [Aggregatibacter actinomycetemcomitans]